MTMQRIPKSDAIPRQQFHALVRAWLRDTDDPQVGPLDVKPETAWVHIRVGFRVFALHAGTTRAAAERYIGLADRVGDDLQWVIHRPERRGPEVIAYGLDGERVDDFLIFLA